VSWLRHGLGVLTRTSRLRRFGVLDSKTDATIQSSLQNELSETTQHIVGHRLQTIMDADKIVSPLHGYHLAYVSTSDCLEHVDSA
jgi:ABC-type bacteriocin/lantibiotic exporter with double-glycine peptidase domain